MPNKYINVNTLLQDIERSRSDNNHNNPIASQVHNGEHRHFIKMVLDQPAADVVSRELFEQIKWERDIAMSQLEEHGIAFGMKKEYTDVVKVVRCKDCVYYSPDNKSGLLHSPCSRIFGVSVCHEDSFCSYGERKEQRK